MDDLIAKIRAEIEKDERLANGEDEQAHNERHWPDRIERQAAAFRKILDWCDRSIAQGEPLPEGAAEGRDPDEIERDRAIAEGAKLVAESFADIYEIKHP